MPAASAHKSIPSRIGASFVPNPARRRPVWENVRGEKQNGGLGWPPKNGPRGSRSEDLLPGGAASAVLFPGRRLGTRSALATPGDRCGDEHHCNEQDHSRKKFPHPLTPHALELLVSGKWRVPDNVTQVPRAVNRTRKGRPARRPAISHVFVTLFSARPGEHHAVVRWIDRVLADLRHPAGPRCGDARGTGVAHAGSAQLANSQRSEGSSWRPKWRRFATS